ncbi:hypothetical protein N624_2207 [Levilactobacillus brevis]|nr:hypothetical protein N624_2207 [Levilactobacillus brevis]
MTDKHKPSQQLYTDAYFERGHWGLKVRQTLVALVGWICVIVPIVITIAAFLAVDHPQIPHLWTYREGIFEIKFIGILLLFAFVMVLLFAVGMTIIQNRKRERVVEQWPTYNPINQRKRETELEKLWMTDLATQIFAIRFGDTKLTGTELRDGTNSRALSKTTPE